MKIRYEICTANTKLYYFYYTEKQKWGETGNTRFPPPLGTGASVLYQHCNERNRDYDILYRWALWASVTTQMLLQRVLSSLNIQKANKEYKHLALVKCQLGFIISYIWDSVCVGVHGCVYVCDTERFLWDKSIRHDVTLSHYTIDILVHFRITINIDYYN